MAEPKEPVSLPAYLANSEFVVGHMDEGHGEDSGGVAHSKRRHSEDHGHNPASTPAGRPKGRGHVHNR